MRSAILLGTILWASLGWTQGQGSDRPRATAPSQPEGASVVPTNPFLGGVTSGQATAEEIPLKMADAIQAGLRNNLGALLGSSARASAEGTRIKTRADLLPQLTTRTSRVEQQVDLAAFGFKGFSGVSIPNVIGPFGIFDTRAYLSQSLVDLKSWHAWKSDVEDARAASLSYQDARDLVVLVVGDLYLLVNAQRARVDSARAQVETAQRLYDQAVEFKAAGTVPAIDVLRADVQLRNLRQRLISTENDYEKSKLNLGRAIGLPPGQRFRLTDDVPYRPADTPTIEAALAQAYAGRNDYQAALARVRAAEQSKKSKQGERWPVLAFNADYGTIGNSFDRTHGTFTVGASLSIPIFRGARENGEIQEADADLKQRQNEAAELRSRIEVELRSEFLDLKSAADRLEVAIEAQKLAALQLEQARDRFASGVTTNLEVVQSQDAVATATENYILNLYTFNVTKGNLLHSLGGAENTFRRLMLGEK